MEYVAGLSIYQKHANLNQMAKWENLFVSLLKALKRHWLSMEANYNQIHYLWNSTDKDPIAKI